MEGRVRCPLSILVLFSKLCFFATFCLHFTDGSYGFSLDNYNGSIIVKEGLMSEIEFSWRNLTAPYRVFVLHKPTDLKHLVTMCRLRRSQDTCTSSNDQLCQCLNPDHFRLTKTFRVEDTGQLLFQLFDIPSLNKLINISVLPERKRPTHPHVTCSPQPFVQENTNISCTCIISDLSFPSGSLKWIVGNRITTGIELVGEKGSSPLELRYQKTLAAADHNNTWIRCDVVWQGDVIQGEVYTASVAYSHRSLKMTINDESEDMTVSEGDPLTIRCEADGQPTPEMKLERILDNRIVKKGLSPLSHSTTARCDVTDLYTCSANNQLQGKVQKTSRLDVTCKPRNVSSLHLGTVKVGDKPQVLQFEVISYPPPTSCILFFMASAEDAKGNSTQHELDTSTTVTCTPYPVRRHMSQCTLSVTDRLYLSGLYGIQITNDVGQVNFTFEITLGEILGIFFLS
ncbi:uncharacterized protein LOC112569092 [Pomacea canaliculata]|uniref:uncharacterized protein LOC112569092 n=1 Tax=Pomacea canaliculata TaxID=400727 RepID=UPI000D73DB48|nr:uncharacterized protein LOC112569092 [Pomacea canaliculata]